MYFGYNTNGFAHHRLDDALRIVADLGFTGVAITLDFNSLDPFAASLPRDLASVHHLLERLRLRSVIETGARFLLDPWRKHQPTLISAEANERDRRVDFLRRAVDIAAELGSDAVSFWSGAPNDNAGFGVHMDRLVDGCQQLADFAASKDVRLAFEPEPGMLIDTMPRFAALHGRLAHPFFGLTLDIGHLHCLGELPIEEHIHRWRDHLWNIHIEDMRRGVHDHLLFGEGDIDFRPVLQALHAIEYASGVHVELSRHSHNAVETARQSLRFLRQVEEGADGSRVEGGC